MHQSVVQARRSAVLAVSALVASAPAAMGASSSWIGAGESELVLGPAGAPETAAETSFDALAPSVAPVAVVAPVASAPAQYDDRASGFYLRLGAGLITSTSSDGPGEEIDFDEGYIISAAAGKRFPGEPNNLGFDVEVEGIWTDQDTDEEGPIESVEDVTVIGVLINGVVDYRLAERFSVYGGAGAGTSWMDIGTQSDALNDFDDEDGPFLTWQLKAGLKLLNAAGGAFHFGYRFLNVDDVEIDDDVGGASFDLETEQHGLELGYTFGTSGSY